MGGSAISILLISSLLCLTGCSAGSTVLPAQANQHFDEVSDQALQQAAEHALGEVEGSVIVIDSQTGRLRAVINPRLAFEQSFPPGSAIKPFTLLAAWRSGLIDPETKHLCQTRYEYEGFSIVCSHPPSARPFSIDQALAWSCNDFFAHIGERLSEGSFNGLLSEFGFGRRTGVNATESAGRLKAGDWNIANALGDGDALLVTPIQLMSAYSALINGGTLVRPWLEDDSSGQKGITRRINISARFHDQLLKGMQGAISYGTASKSGLNRSVVGKTGTSTSSNGFRSHGWFVGFAEDEAAAKLGVLVFIRRGNGARAAMIAAGVFECALTRKNCGKTQAIAQQVTASLKDRSFVRVRSIGQRITRELPIEEYLAGILMGEAGAEKRIEALKAQAVVSRTFALRNMGRHFDEGYDFCSTTHCQRFIAARPSTNRLVRRAVTATAGLILADQRGDPIDAYFHAACGGRTADIETLWGVRPAPDYLRGVRDDYCAAQPHRNWSQTISAESLRQALESDKRSAVGARLHSVNVTRLDSGGRAQRLMIEGTRRIELSGWEFKMIVGRYLGWQMIKSSLFNVTRSGDSFIFRGGGFGHGLGMCQEGARGAAGQGMLFNRILEHYYPGTRLITAELSAIERFDRADRYALVKVVDSLSGPQRSDGILSSEHFQLRVVRSPLNPSPEAALRILEPALRDLDARLERAGVPVSRSRSFEVVVHGTTTGFIEATGLSGWSSGATRGNTIQLQPLEILRKRRIFETTLRHELAHAMIEIIGYGRSPRWLAEGLAIHFAGEAASLPDVSRLARPSRREIDDKLAIPQPHRETRLIYAQAYREVRNLIRSHGEAHLWKIVAGKNREISSEAGSHI